MRHVVITTWELVAGVDFEMTIDSVKKKRLPALREFGAKRIQVIRTSERTIAAVTEWPDRTTWESAQIHIDRVRKEIRNEDHTRMTGEFVGPVVAEA